MPYRAPTVEQLKRREDLTLNQDAGDDGRGGPQAGADGHFEEPLFERELSHCATESSVSSAAAA
jgi:hypothetical protein